MAKAKPETKPETKEAAADAPKYGVSDLAEALGIEPASVRVKLRKLGIEKSGRSYGWNTKKELDEVVKQCKADTGAAPKGKTDDEDEDEAPAPKTKKKGKAKANA